MMGRFFLLISLVFVGFFWSAPVQAAGKFAYVDVPRVMDSSQAGNRARDFLNKKLSVKQNEVSSMEADINKMKDDLEKRKSVMTAEARSELAGKIRRKYREFQRLVEDNQASVDRENRHWTTKLTKALREVIEEVGREQKFTAIFSKGQILFVDPGIDITDMVLNQLNAKTKDWF
ncbi:MAG: OmpH family outer membrane protein [Magnetococcales bacterium]|nr:OmpH family outer membrane protein [Magnetococcales bacterium]